MSLFARLIFTGLVLMIGFSAQSQSEMNLHIHCDTAHFYYSDFVDSLTYYQQKMGQKKDLRIQDKKLELAFYVALNRYPELHHRSIILKLKSISSTMQAQPTPNFIVKRKNKRAYRIFVNDNPELTGINYQDLSFNALVGWIGHEFAHLIDYSSMNNRELLGFIAAYVFDKREMRKTERQADKETIKRGLGIQLLDGVAFFEKKTRRYPNDIVREKRRITSPKKRLSPTSNGTAIRSCCNFCL